MRAEDAGGEEDSGTRCSAFRDCKRIARGSRRERI